VKINKYIEVRRSSATDGKFAMTVRRPLTGETYITYLDITDFKRLLRYGINELKNYQQVNKDGQPKVVPKLTLVEDGGEIDE